QVTELRLRDVVGHGIYQSAQVMLARALRGESTSFDRLVPGANGVRRWMTIRVVPDMSAEREIAGAFVLMNDIHGLKQAQEALRELDALLAHQHPAARRAGMGPRLPAGALVAAGRAHLRLARRRSAGHAAYRKPAHARVRSRGGGRADQQADGGRGTPGDGPH